MDNIKQTFEESELFKLSANFPEYLAKKVIENCGDLSEEQKEHITAGFMEIGFFLTAAASASFRLTHAVDLMRNHGSIGPDIRYLIMEASSELTNAVVLNEPIVKVTDALMKFGEDVSGWSTVVPDDLPDEGIRIEYLRNYTQVVPGKLLYFRFTDMENKTVITDIPCIYDTELFSFMPLTNNPAWKYVNESGNNAASNELVESTPSTDAEESQESTDGGSSEG